MDETVLERLGYYAVFQSGEKRLMLAVIHRAICDYGADVKTVVTQAEREDATDWLFNDFDTIDEKFSLRHLCHHLNLSVKKVRAAAVDARRLGIGDM